MTDKKDALIAAQRPVGNSDKLKSRPELKPRPFCGEGEAVRKRNTRAEPKRHPYEEDMLIYAFRYCLGRTTYATGICADFILSKWGGLSESAKELLLREIKEALRTNNAGMGCDVAQWQRILDMEKTDD